MTVMSGNGAGRISRALLWGLLGLLGWWGWGFSPVAAADYLVTTGGGGTINYSCSDGAADFSGGTYTIGTAAELAVFAGIINQTESPTAAELTSGTPVIAPNPADLSSNAMLTGNITLRDTDGWNIWDISPPDTSTILQWTPIGSASHPYSGSFDGQGYTIKGIYISDAAKDNQGLFGVTAAGSAIDNLTVSESYISARDYVGALVGLHYGYMTACHNSGNISGQSEVGGLAGQVLAPYGISECHNSGKVTGNGLYVGGVVGLCEGTVSLSSNVGAISSTGSGTVDYLGGVAGEAYYVFDCFNSGFVNGLSFVGGVAGMSFGTLRSANSGTVNGNNHVGGVIGGVSTINGWINNCYNSGTISGGDRVGGITGNAKAILNNCFNTGAVAGATNIGLVAGYGESTTVTDCYYAADTTSMGIGNGSGDQAGQIEFKTAAAFSSGEVAWLLQKGQADPAVQVWGQKLGGVETQPLLKTTDRVYGLTLMRGNDVLFERRFRNATDTTVVSTSTPGIKWQDGDTEYTEITAAADVTLYPWLAAPPTNIPTATAVYGTPLADISFSGDSDPAGSWIWQGTPEELAQQLAVGKSTAATARLIATDDPGGIYEGPITPVITPRSLSADEVIISQPANATYTGAAITPAITVSDSAAEITADDYTVTYTNNVSPGTATVTITGQGNYKDTVTRDFTITGGGGGGGYTPPSMSGITVTPQAISFDPSGRLAVDIAGLPAGAVVFYSLDEITYNTTPPTITRAGEQRLYLRITCPGYQDYTTQTMVTVAKQLAPEIPIINAAVSGGQPAGSTDLAVLLPANRGLTQYQLGPVNDPGGLLDGAPSIDDKGVITYNSRRFLSSEGANAEQSAGVTTAAAKTATITVLVSMENYQDTTLTLVVTEAEPLGVRYLTHIQDYGWERDWVTAGALSGTAGQSKRLEALKVELTGDLPADASIETAVHVQNQGDLGPFAMGSAAGTSGKSLRLENITLTLNNLPGYSLHYNVHVQNQGWLRDENDPSSWFSSGEVAGTSGKSLRLEGIRIELVKDE